MTTEEKIEIIVKRIYKLAKFKNKQFNCLIFLIFKDLQNIIKSFLTSLRDLNFNKVIKLFFSTSQKVVDILAIFLIIPNFLAMEFAELFKDFILSIPNTIKVIIVETYNYIIYKTYEFLNLIIVFIYAFIEFFKGIYYWLTNLTFDEVEKLSITNYRKMRILKNWTIHAINITVLESLIWIDKFDRRKVLWWLVVWPLFIILMGLCAFTKKLYTDRFIIASLTLFYVLFVIESSYK